MSYQYTITDSSLTSVKLSAIGAGGGYGSGGVGGDGGTVSANFAVKVGDVITGYIGFGGNNGGTSSSVSGSIYPAPPIDIIACRDSDNLGIGGLPSTNGGGGGSLTCVTLTPAGTTFPNFLLIAGGGGGGCGTAGGNGGSGVAGDVPSSFNGADADGNSGSGGITTATGGTGGSGGTNQATSGYIDTSSYSFTTGKGGYDSGAIYGAGGGGGYGGGGGGSITSPGNGGGGGSSYINTNNITNDSYQPFPIVTCGGTGLGGTALLPIGMQGSFSITLSTPITQSVAKSTITSSVAKVLADGISFSTITVTLLDDSSNPVVGKSVRLVPSGSSTTTYDIINTAISSPSGVVVFKVFDTVPGSPVTYNAFDITDSINIVPSTPATVTFIPVVPDSASSSISATPLNVNSGASSTITVKLLDSNGNPVTNTRNITLVQSLVSGGASNSTIKPSSVVSSDGNGNASFTVTDSLVEEVLYTASDTTTAGSSITLNNCSIVINFSAANVSPTNSSISASPTSVTADNSTSSTITVTVKDTNNQLVSGKNISLNQGTGKSTIKPANVLSVNGIATFTVTDQSVEKVNYSAIDNSDTSLTIGTGASVNFTAPASPPYFQYNFSTTTPNIFNLSLGLLRQYNSSQLTPQPTSSGPSSFSDYTFQLTDPTNLPPLYTNSSKTTKVPAWPTNGILLPTYYYQPQGDGNSTTCTVGLYKSSDLTKLVAPPVSIIFQDPKLKLPVSNRQYTTYKIKSFGLFMRKVDKTYVKN